MHPKFDFARLLLGGRKRCTLLRAGDRCMSCCSRLKSYADSRKNACSWSKCILTISVNWWWAVWAIVLTAPGTCGPPPTPLTEPRSVEVSAILPSDSNWNNPTKRQNVFCNLTQTRPSAPGLLDPDRAWTIEYALHAFQRITAPHLRLHVRRWRSVKSECRSWQRQRYFHPSVDNINGPRLQRILHAQTLSYYPELAMDETLMDPHSGTDRLRLQSTLQSTPLHMSVSSTSPNRHLIPTPQPRGVRSSSNVARLNQDRAQPYPSVEVRDCQRLR